MPRPPAPAPAAAGGCSSAAGSAPPASTPTSVTALLHSLSGLKALAIERGYANAWLQPQLAPLLAQSAELRATFACDLDWDPQQLFAGEQPTIDLVKLVAKLQKYLYERLPGTVGARLSPALSQRRLRRHACTAMRSSSST